jgi:flavodoxin
MKKFLRNLLVLGTIIVTGNSVVAAEKPLVVYFSYFENANLPAGVDASASASIQVWNGKNTGNTGVVTNIINEKVGGDIYPILVADKYPTDYDETVSRGRDEQNRNYRPQLVNHIENFNDYDTVFIGFPNWWYDMPMAMYSFFEEYDFSGKTIIPFVTSGGSGFSNTVSTIKSLEPNATILEGISISGRRVMGAEENVTEWLEELNYSK